MHIVGKNTLLGKAFESTGNWLFQRRSYLPLFFIPLFALAAKNISYPWGSHALDEVWEIFCLFISLCGLAIRVLTVGYVPKRTSGRNTRKGQVADTLNTTGMYSIVRHPLYLGNFFIFLGISLFPRVWWYSFICILVYVVCYERIMFAEEGFLLKKFGSEYLAWARQTPAIIPDLRLWKKPSFQLSFRTVLKREYLTLFAITSIFTFMEIIQDFVVQETLILDWLWVGIFAFGLTTFAVLRVCRKRTNILHVSGR